MDEFFIVTQAVGDADGAFESDRRAAQQKVADAENDLLIARLDRWSRGRFKTIRAAKEKLRAAIETLNALEEDWLNEHAFDDVAY